MTELDALKQYTYAEYRTWCADHGTTARSANGYRVKRTRLGLSNEGMLQTAEWNTVATLARQERAHLRAIALDASPPPVVSHETPPELILLYSDVRAAEQSPQDFARRSDHIRDVVLWSQERTGATKLTICNLGNLIGKTGRSYDIDPTVTDLVALVAERKAADAAAYAAAFETVAELGVSPVERNNRREDPDRLIYWLARRLSAGIPNVTWSPPDVEPRLVEIGGLVFMLAKDNFSIDLRNGEPKHCDYILSSARAFDPPAGFIANGRWTDEEPIQRLLVVLGNRSIQNWGIPLPSEVAVLAD